MISISRKFLVLVAFFAYSSLHGEPRWNWAKIQEETNDFSFEALPHLKNIPHWGAGSSCLQTAGLATAGTKPVANNWTEWLEEKEKPSIGTACNSWVDFEKDIACLKHAGCNTYRFSIEWSKIEPEEGQFNQEAMNWYIRFTNALIANGIKPVPTLFHHAWPSWLSNGFETADAIEKFNRYGQFVYRNVMTQATDKKMVDTWITLNEPIGYAMGAYIEGSYPPGKKREFCTCGQVCYNFLQAHNASYDSLHAIAEEFNTPLHLGIAKVFNPIQAFTWYNVFDASIAYYMNYLLNDSMLEYYRTGNFNWCSSLPNGIQKFDPEAPSKLDFIGINYYSHTLISWFKSRTRDDEIASDIDPKKHPKVIYAEGFYEAIKKAASLEKPIWITENGFASENLEHRTNFFKQHMYALNKALQEIPDIKILGYLFWTLVDGYEWNVGKSNYGMFTSHRAMKPSITYFVELLKWIKS